MALSKIDVANMLTGATPVANGGTAATTLAGAGLAKRPNAKPLIFNGDMQVAQRGTSSTGVGNGDSGYPTIDRWRFDEGGDTSAEFTMTQATDVPTGYGFTKSLKLDCTTADASPGASDIVRIEQRFEGQDLQGLKKGTSNAEKLTLSFWVKSTKTGTFIAELIDSDNSRHVSTAYTVSSSDTWENKVVNFPADTTGAFDNDNAESLRVIFNLIAGSNYTDGTLATSWAAYNDGNEAVGQVNIGDNTSNNWLITGVQLEVGEFTSSTLPPFQHESFADNLARCHRYCYVMGASANAENGGQFTIGSGLCRSSGSAIFTDIVGSYPQPLRTLPSVTQVGGDMADLFCYKDDGTSADPSSIAIGRNTIALKMTNNMGTSSGLSAGDATVQQIVEDDTDLVFDAEL